jgi:hypothetical protein
VRETDSAEMSTANQASPSTPPLSTTVRHTPEHAMEAPVAIPAGSNGQVMTARKSPDWRASRMVPMAVTMPVNMGVS